MSKRRQISPRNIMPDELLPKRRPAMDNVMRSSAALERNRRRVLPPPPNLEPIEVAPPPPPPPLHKDKTRITGKFTGWAPGNRFGFIRPDASGTTVLVTAGALLNAEHCGRLIVDELRPGDRLRFAIRDDGRGPAARDIELAA